MLVAEFGAVLKVLEIHVVFGYELERSCLCSCLAGVVFAHALHCVSVAEGGCVTEIAIETTAINLGQKMLALLVNHRNCKFLVEGRVAIGPLATVVLCSSTLHLPKAHSDAIPPPGFLVDWRRCLGAFLDNIANGVVLDGVVEGVLAVELESH